MAVVHLNQANIGLYSLCADSKTPVADIEFDLNQFRDPLGNMTLRSTCVDGRDQAVRDWIKADPRYKPLVNQCLLLASDRFNGGGKWLSLGFRDYHGKWISRAVAGLVAEELAAMGYDVGILHAATQD